MPQEGVFGYPKINLLGDDGLTKKMSRNCAGFQLFLRVRKWTNMGCSPYPIVKNKPGGG